MIRKLKDIIYILKNSNLVVRATFILIIIMILSYIKATCFADNFKSWELVDLQNAIANNLITSGITEEQAKNSIDAKEEQLKTIVNYLNEYHYTYLAWRNNKELDILCTNIEDHWYLYRNFPMINGGSNVSSINYNITYSNNSLNISQLSNNNSAGSYNHNANIYYTGNKIYSSYNNNTIIRNGGDYSPSTLFDKNVYLGKYFEINLNTNNNTEYFNIVTDTGNDIEDIAVLNSYNFGTLEDNTYIYYIHDLLGFWYWTGNSWTYKTIYNRNKDMVLLKNNEYMNYSYFNNYESANLIINSLYQYKNVIYHYQITNSEFNSVDAYFLIGDDTTLITNNTIDTTNFNNNYLSQFEGLDNIINNNDNTQNIIKAIESGEQKAEERQTFWENTYNSLFTIDSGEAETMLNDLYNNLEVSIGSGEVETIKQVASILQGQPDDFIISWNDIYIPNLFNNEPTKLIEQGQINFSEEVRNNEALSRAKGWLNIIVSTILLLILLMNYGRTIAQLLGTTIEFIEDEEVTYDVLNITLENDQMIPPTNMPIPMSYSRNFRNKVWKEHFKRR